MSPKLALADNTSYIIYTSSTIKTLEGKFVPEKNFKFSTEDSNRLLASLSLGMTRELSKINLQFNHPIVGYDQPDALRIINTSDHIGSLPVYSITINPQDQRKITILTFSLLRPAHYTLLIGDMIKDQSTGKNVYNSKLEFTTSPSIIVNAKHDSTCTIVNKNTYCWGANGNAQLGTGDKINRTNATLIEQPEIDPTQFYTISVAGNHTCGIDYASYKASCWGNNTYGQLGTGSSTEYRIQKQINMPANTYFYSIASGCDTTCAIGSNYNTYCWGRGTEGQLGNMQNLDRNTPTPITMPENIKYFTTISVGDRHVCAIGDNKVYCWGDNNKGQLGDDTNIDRIIPIVVQMPPDAKTLSSISLGTNHTCVTSNSNNAYCWGDNTSGQLGIGTNDSSNVPVKVIFPIDPHSTSR